MNNTSVMAEKLCQYQIANNRTQHQMAESLNISQTTYNNWINGKSGIDFKYYSAIANLIGENLSAIIPTNLEVTLSLPSQESDYTIDALSLLKKLNYHVEERLAFQIRENERLRRENEELQLRLNHFLAS